MTTFGYTSTQFQKVLIIVFENTDFSNALKQPYLNSLTKEGALLTNYHGLTHPSQGNYIGLISGSLYGVTNDGPINIDYPHIGDLLEDKGYSWKAYAEGYPGNCFLGKTNGKYVRKHVPFLSFVNVQKDSNRCSRINNEKAFFQDFNNQSLPTYSLYIPNLDSDSHDTGASYADTWFKKNFDSIIHSASKPDDLLIVITFDESSGNRDNQIYTILIGANVKKGSTSSKFYNHYSLLRTIEDHLNLGTLHQNDLTASSIDDIWSN